MTFRKVFISILVWCILLLIEMSVPFIHLPTDAEGKPFPIMDLVFMIAGVTLIFIWRKQVMELLQGCLSLVFIASTIALVILL